MKKITVIVFLTMFGLSGLVYADKDRSDKANDKDHHSKGHHDMGNDKDHHSKGHHDMGNDKDHPDKEHHGKDEKGKKK